MFLGDDFFHRTERRRQFSQSIAAAEVLFAMFDDNIWAEFVSKVILIVQRYKRIVVRESGDALCQIGSYFLKVPSRVSARRG